MYDKKIVYEVLSLIIKSSQTVIKRFEPIHSLSDFTDSPTGTSMRCRRKKLAR